MSEIISRKVAVERGLKTYFTGKACPAGHIAARGVENRGCRECSRLAALVKYQDNAEELRAKGRDGYYKNRERNLARSTLWNRDNADKVRERQKARVATPIGRATILVANAVSRCRTYDLEFDLTVEFVFALLSEALATGVVTCNSDQPDTASLDQIQPGGGYTKENVQVVPQWYNFAKNDFSAVSLHEAMSRWRLVYG